MLRIFLRKPTRIVFYRPEQTNLKLLQWYELKWCSKMNTVFYFCMQLKFSNMIFLWVLSIMLSIMYSYFKNLWKSPSVLYWDLQKNKKSHLFYFLLHSKLDIFPHKDSLIPDWGLFFGVFNEMTPDSMNYSKLKQHQDLMALYCLTSPETVLQLCWVAVEIAAHCWWTCLRN